MNQSSTLFSILQGCLNPSTVQICEKQLVDYSNRTSFISELLQLLPNQSNEIAIMILSTVKNYVAEKYSNPHSPMPEDQKELLRTHIFHLFYIIKDIPQAVNLYKEIVHMIVAVDFQKHTALFYNLLKEDLQGGNISASIYFSRQVARVYQWLTLEQRKPLENFINDLFPQLEELVEKILTDYNSLTRRLLKQLLQMFYSAFHIEVPQYLRNFSNVEKWLFYLTTILKAPMDDFPENHIQVSRIYVKFFTMYCRDGTDGKAFKGWGAQFRQKYAVNLYNQVVQILVAPLNNQDLMTNILVCLSAVVNNPDLNFLMQEDHCKAIIYKHLLPFMESTNEDYSYFKSDGLQFIRRSEDLTCHPYRRASLDLIKNIAQKFNFGTKSELIKLVEHSAIVLGGNGYTEKQKEVIIIVLTELVALIMKNKFLKNNFESLVQQYFIPLLKSNQSIVVAQTLNMLSVFLKRAELSTEVVSDLMGLLYDKMCEDNIVVKYYAILAFTQLLDDKQALEKARPHFQNILTIYVKLLQVIDHEGLISSLKSIVQSFSAQIVGVADDLANHLFSMFYSLHTKEEEDNEDEENDGRQATAALSTIRQILQSPLPDQTYYNISEKVMILLQNLCSQYDDYFQEVLNMLNTLVYKAHNIVNYEFPYLLCRKLLEGDNQILKNCANGEFVSIVAEAEQADTQYSQSLISILKNLIQKMPSSILHSYPYSGNPQLILCMIENKKIDQSALPMLNMSQIDKQWNLILQSYTAVVYGLGEVCQPEQLKMLNGVSLYPWIQCRLNAEVIRKLILALQDDEGDDDYYEENTAQMLEKFANEDDEDDAGDYYISSGGNYSYMYDSPFNPTQDQQHLLSKLRQLSGQQMNSLLGQLTVKQRNKLEAMFNQ